MLPISKSKWTIRVIFVLQQTNFTILNGKNIRIASLLRYIDDIPHFCHFPDFYSKFPVGHKNVQFFRKWNRYMMSIIPILVTKVLRYLKIVLVTPPSICPPYPQFWPASPWTIFVHIKLKGYKRDCMYLEIKKY